MNARVIAACAVACCSLIGAAAVASAHGGGHTGGSATTPHINAFRGTTTTMVRPLAAGGPMGIMHLTQRGRLLSGFVVVWGLEPGSSHAAHLHGLADGSSARCLPQSKRTTRHVANLPDLTADASGVAFGVIRLGVNEEAVRRGVYAMVHTHPSPPVHMAGMVHDNPPIACGNLS